MDKMTASEESYYSNSWDITRLTREETIENWKLKVEIRNQRMRNEQIGPVLSKFSNFHGKYSLQNRKIQKWRVKHQKNFKKFHFQNDYHFH